MSDLASRWLDHKKRLRPCPFSALPEMTVRPKYVVHESDIDELVSQITALRAEVKRLRAGGCARDQNTTQYCAEASRLAAENERLRTALEKAINACDQGRMVEQGVGGMTIEAQMRRSVYNGVPVWPIEEARDVLCESRAALAGSSSAEQEKPNE